MSEDGNAKKGFTAVASVTASGNGMKVGRTGDDHIDKAVAFLDAEGFQLRQMTMPPGLTVMGFENPEKQMMAVIVHKHGEGPVRVAGGQVLTESQIAIAPRDSDASPEDVFVPVARYLAEREAGTRRVLHTLRLN